MLTRPETADPAVEELKRRARRRLVGAIVLALAAAVILPMLLESDPKPLGDDVSIQIPPIDNGKFVTPLSPARTSNAKTAPDAAGSSIPATPATGQKAAEAAPDSAADAKSAAATLANGNPRDVAQATPPDVAPATAPPPTVAAAPIPEAKTLSAPPTKSVSGDSGPVPASAAGSFVVQVAAFADAKAAPALASKLKSAGFPAYVDTVKTQKGPMKRVRTGPYATREIADAQLAKLTAAGYRGVVTTK
jgi:DedD protein